MQLENGDYELRAVTYTPPPYSCYSARLVFAECIGVTDGDTLEGLRDHTAIKVRLEGIDCPERGQDFGQKAKQFTSALVFGKTVEIRPVGGDRYGRTVARVIVGGKDVSEELLKAGLAWHFKKYSKNQGMAGLE